MLNRVGGTKRGQGGHRFFDIQLMKWWHDIFLSCFRSIGDQGLTIGWFFGRSRSRRWQKFGFFGLSQSPSRNCLRLTPVGDGPPRFPYLPPTLLKVRHHLLQCSRTTVMVVLFDRNPYFCEKYLLKNTKEISFAYRSLWFLTQKCFGIF